MFICKDINQAEQYVRKIYPDLKNHAFDTSQQGVNSFVFMTENEVIKVPRNNSSAQSMITEFALLKEIEAEISVRIPEPQEFDEYNRVMRLGKVHGEALDVLNIRDIPDEEIEGMTREFAKFSTQLHSLPLDCEDQLEIDRQDKEPICNYIIKMAKKFNCENEVSSLESCIESFYEPNDYVLCHSDLWLGNLIYDKEYGKAGVIDFNSTSINHPYRDIMFFDFDNNDLFEVYSDEYKKHRDIEINVDQVRLYSLATGLLHNKSINEPNKLINELRDRLTI